MESGGGVALAGLDIVDGFERLSNLLDFSDFNEQ